ncbi:MAG: cytochrome c3 family protein [Acidobacteria bacterium]|nr:cytochrome c3 family protein [Acidobacteriota bacterium]
MRTALRVLALLLVTLGASPAASAAAGDTSCTRCHTNPDMVDANAIAIVKAFEKDVHAVAGLSCHDCHGGNPDPAMAEDLDAMSESFKANPFAGTPKHGDIPAFCGRCHSDLAYMRKYQPAARTDQLQEYWTSRHGIALKKGDPDVATCIDCHGVHGIRAVADIESSVHPSRVAETCGKCHSDPKRMAMHSDPSGRPLPVDQYARWRRSVHAAALLERGDLSAPTCNDCHGNHGANPPGVEDVSFTCGQCHGREAALFRASAKHSAFSEHNDLLKDADEGCATCHDNLGNVTLRSFGECVTCHENHGVIRPTVALLGAVPETPCALCHEPLEGFLGDRFDEPAVRRKNFETVRDQLLAAAKAQNLTGNARFDWLVDQAQVLPFHTTEPESADTLRAKRPEFARLWEKFRIGKTHYAYTDPATGKEVSVPVRSCVTCHSEVDSAGLKTSVALMRRMHELTSAVARAERILLTAQRGGVEVRAARTALDEAVDRDIELQVLVHTFSADKAFDEKQKEGLASASTALGAGQRSMNELRFRRRGLFVSLGLIAIVLVALAMKIRDLAPRS